MNATPLTFASLADLLATFKGDTKKMLNQACLLRLEPDGSVFMVPDTFRGSIDLPQGADVHQVMTSPDGSDIIGADGISKDFVQELLAGFIGDEYKVWRLGGSARNGLIRYNGVNTELVDIDANGQTLLRDDNMAPVMVKVAFNKQQGETLTVTGPNIAPAIEAPEAIAGGDTAPLVQVASDQPDAPTSEGTPAVA